jgi:type IV pilus assembly protein PilB
MAVGQRLVRKVCKECSVLIAPNENELEEIKKHLQAIPKYIGIPENLDQLQIAKASEKGCQTCNFTGYKGRKGLYEVLLIDEEMGKYILTNPPVSEIKALAVKKGMITIYQSGLIEIVFGNTTFEEIRRVVEED